MGQWGLPFWGQANLADAMAAFQVWVRRNGALWRRFGTVPRVAALVPALSLAAFAFGGETGLLALALVAPFALWFAGYISRNLGFAGQVPAPRDLDDLVYAADRAVAQRSAGACYVALFHDLPKIRLLHGPAGIDALIDGVFARVASGSRNGDRVARLHDAGIAVFLTVPDQLGAEAALIRAQRLLESLAQPVLLGAARVFASASVGYCRVDHAGIADGQALLDAARLAAEDALAHAPGAIRAFETGHLHRRCAQSALHGELERALGSGQIRPWFQPQICADTFAITGAEALARWVHPERGLIPTADFLPMIAASGRSEALTRTMLSGALDALGRWDRAGIRVPHVAINLGAEDLRNPHLPDVLTWELDRFGKPPERLTIEILEDVAARTNDDVITRNLARICAMGCGIDMDDLAWAKPQSPTFAALTSGGSRLIAPLSPALIPTQNKSASFRPFCQWPNAWVCIPLPKGSKRRRNFRPWLNWAVNIFRVLESRTPWRPTILCCGCDKGGAMTSCSLAKPVSGAELTAVQQS